MEEMTKRFKELLAFYNEEKEAAYPDLPLLFTNGLRIEVEDLIAELSNRIFHGLVSEINYKYLTTNNLLSMLEEKLLK